MPSTSFLRRIGCVVAVLLSVLSASAQPPVADFSADNQSGCSPLVVQFQDRSTGNPTQWTWYLGNGTISQQKNPGATYFQPGTYHVKLVAKNSAGADSITKSHFITVYAGPLPRFSVSDSTGCVPSVIRFADQSDPGSGTITKWTWDFGDGNISNEQHPVHTYTAPGSYHVTLRVTNSFGCQKTITRQHLIRLENIKADFSYTGGSGCATGNTVSFTSAVPGAVSYRWHFGDGGTATSANPAHLYAAPGTYQVKLVLKNNSGCSDSVVKAVVVGAINADFSVATACAGGLAVFQNTSSPAPLGASWDFGDGSSSTDLNPQKVFSTAGTYQVRLISDFGGCKDTVVKNITVHPKPSAAFTHSGIVSACSGPVSPVFNATAAGLSYQWNFGDGTTSPLRNPVHTYTTSGIYDVTLVTTNAGGCSDTVTTKELVKIIPPRIMRVNGASFRGCTPYTANLGADVESLEPVTTWHWDFGDGGSSSLRNPSHVYTQPGKYTIKLVITTAGGCRDSLIMPAAIQVSNKPVAAFTASPLTVCAAGQVQFTNESTGGEEWFWDFGDGGFSTEKDPLHQFGDTGVFTIRLIASSTGCTDTITRVNYVRNDPPIGRMNMIRDCASPYAIQFRDSSIGGQTYKWFFGDGDSSTLRHPKHVYKAPGVYQVAFTVYHGSCSYLTKATVYIVDERPAISATDTIICRNSPVGFTAVSINAANISSYSWDFGDGNLANSTSPSISHVYTKTGVYYARLITTDILGCTDTTAMTRIQVFGPTADFTTVAGSCVNSTVVFNDASKGDGTHAITNWQWNFGDGGQQAGASPSASHLYTSSGTFNLQLKVTDSYGCTDSLMKPSALIITRPEASFAPADSVKCAANNVSFINNSQGLDLSYAWNFGDGRTATTTNGTNSYAAEGIYTVRLTVTDRFGCRDSVLKQQLVSNPKAAFAASDSFSSCPPLMVSLSNSSSAVTGLSWDFGDGSKSDVSNPSHYYTYPGTYRLKLTVNGFGECRDSAYKTIVIKGPTGTFRFNPDTICVNGNVAFTASSSGSTKFFWDFSDGVTRSTTDSVVTHAYESPGFYQPKLILIDTAGCEVAISSPDTIKVMGVNAKFAFENSLFCDSVTLQFRDSSVVHNDLPAKYSWSFGDGGFSNAAQPQHTYSNPGAYTVKLTVTSQAGCTDSATTSLPIVVHKSPSVKIKSRPSVCLNDTIGFEGVEVSAHTYQLRWLWDFSEGRTAEVQNPSESFSSEGNYPVKVIAISDNGCSDTATTSILVHPLPDLTAGTDTMICRGQSYTLQASGAAIYQWQQHALLSCVDCPTPEIRPVQPETFYLTGTSQFGCVNTDSVRIDVLQPFTMQASLDDSLCAGGNVQLRANGAARYNWYPAAGLSNSSIANPVASPSATTSYMVVGSDRLGCFSDTGYVKVSVFPVPQFNIIENLITVPAGSNATIATSSSPDIKGWKWYPSTGLNCADCPQPVITARDNIVYRAEAWNDGGCITSDKVTVSVVCNDGNVFIPNTFSPNNDGMNDVFYPRGKGVNGIRRMKVFNRWGELVYERADFSANDPNAGWNGMYKGLQLTPDVYVYIVDVVCDNSTVFTLKGNVTLIR